MFVIIEKSTSLVVDIHPFTDHFDPDRFDFISVDDADHSLLLMKYNYGTKNFEKAVKTLDDVKSDKLSELLAAKQAAFTTFNSSALGTPHTYPADEEAQKNFQMYTNLMAVAGSSLTTIDFYTDEAGMTSHTISQFVQVLLDFKTFEVNLAKKYEGYATQVGTANDIPAVQAIKWT